MLNGKADTQKGITQEQATDVINKFDAGYKRSLNLSVVFARTKEQVFGPVAEQLGNDRVKGAHNGRSRRALLTCPALDS